MSEDRRERVARSIKTAWDKCYDKHWASLGLPPPPRAPDEELMLELSDAAIEADNEWIASLNPWVFAGVGKEGE